MVTHMSTDVTPGYRGPQFKGKTQVRRVEVIAVDGDTVTVRALNGPLAGAVYDIDRKDLEAA